jgi:hypothetical protein
VRTSLENIPDDQKGPDKPRQTGQIGKYTEVFSEEEIELMEAIMGSNLRRFGYALGRDMKGDTPAGAITSSDAPANDPPVTGVPL